MIESPRPTPGLSLKYLWIVLGVSLIALSFIYLWVVLT
jgi:hypothetical protein